MINKQKTSLLGLLILAVLTATSTLAAEPKEDRAKMITAHEAMVKSHQEMVKCLKTNKPVQECHEELMKACEEHMDKGSCMMGKKKHHREGHETKEKTEKN